MESVHLIVTDEIYTYDNVIAQNHQVETGKCPTKHKRTMSLDGLFVHYFMNELRTNSFYRTNFIRFFTEYLRNKTLVLILQVTRKDLIDYSWNNRMCYMVREKCELDHALSWLSTLGGAFSALGDYFIEYAETAAKISVNQFKLAMRLGDPQIAARCRLYFALSLIQRKNFKLAKKIIHKEFKDGSNAPVVDIRLLRMCKGIWAKLQYEHSQHNDQKCKLKNI